jgi:aspartate/methionine/tyrosine aminotransferase
MSIGEPDFAAPEPVQRAAFEAISKGATQYTAALGLDSLRQRISGWYRSTYRIELPPERVVVTAGASAALLLAFGALVERDAEVLMPDPTYPCNRHFVTAFEGRAKLLPCGPQTRFQLTADQVEHHWSAQTRGILLASPSNPTGTSIRPEVLCTVIDRVRARDGFVVVDEIYQGLSYDEPPTSALALSDDAIVLSSFSKYFNMTGWRLGWLIVPPPLLPVIEKLAQNLFICPSTVAQHAALACFEPDSIAVYEQRRLEFRRRRDFLVPALQRLGFQIPVIPDGAFYIYADISCFSDDSWKFAFEVLHATGVCIVPGRDFGTADPRRYVRISYANAYERLSEAVTRLEEFLAGRRLAAA